MNKNRYTQAAFRLAVRTAKVNIQKLDLPTVGTVGTPVILDKPAWGLVDRKTNKLDKVLPSRALARQTRNTSHRIVRLLAEASH